MKTSSSMEVSRIPKTTLQPLHHHAFATALGRLHHDLNTFAAAGAGGDGYDGDGYGGGGFDSMDYNKNPLFQDQLFAPASTAAGGASMRGNTLFDASPGSAFGGGGTPYGGTAYGAPGFGPASVPRSAQQHRRPPDFFDPDPSLFDPTSPAQELQPHQPASSMDAAPLEPPTATATAIVPLPAGGHSLCLDMMSVWRRRYSCCTVQGPPRAGKSGSCTD